MDEIFESNKSMLKSMLLDEELLVTYLSLSKNLCVHVNNSKLLLARIVDSIRHESPDIQLNISFIVSGAVENNTARTIICLEQDLSKQKESFKNIFFEHIYSVSVGRPSIDTAAYLTVNRFEDFMLCSGYIKSKECDKRTSVEIGDLKSNSQEIVIPEKSKSVPLSLKKIKQETDTTKIGDSDIKSIKSEGIESKSEPIIKHELVPAKKETAVNNKRKTTANSIIKSVNGNKTQKGIVGFFNKSNNSNNKMESKEKEQNGKKEKVESEGIDIKSEKMEVEETIPKIIKIEEKNNENNNRNKILNQIKKTSKVDRKRKRVLHVSDSDSDSENNDPFTDNSVIEQKQICNHESDDEIPPTPTANDIKITSGFLNTKKKRKIVDKTYTGEDDYIITKKEEVYESCSDKEEENEVTEKHPQEKPVKSDSPPKGKISGSKKRISPPQKGKQSTLTNYFKKV